MTMTTNKLTLTWHIVLRLQGQVSVKEETSVFILVLYEYTKFKFRIESNSYFSI